MRRYWTRTLVFIAAVGCLPAAAHAGDANPAVEAALDDLTGKGSVKRLAAVATLRDAGWSNRDVMRLALRMVRWDQDTGLLADLLSKYPGAMLPPLLHRIVHSAPAHRAQICRALGRPRAGNEAAVAVLLVRGLLEPDEQARVMARLALKVASPPSTAILFAHDKLYKKLVDGSMLYVSPGLVLGPAGGRDTPYGRYLRATMRAEAARFGSDTVFRVLRFFTELGEETEALARIQPLIEIQDGAEARKAGRVLAALGSANLKHLEKLAARPAYLAGVARAVGELGEDARAVVPILFRTYRKVLLRPADVDGVDVRDPPGGEEVWERYDRYTPTADVLWGILRTGYRSQELQSGLVDLLDTDLVWIDRSMIEAGLRAIKPNGGTRERLIQLAIRAPAAPSSVSLSALRIVPWCEPPAGRVVTWAEKQMAVRPSRPTTLRLRALRRQILMALEEKDAIALAIVRDLERWSARIGSY